MSGFGAPAFDRKARVRSRNVDRYACATSLPCLIRSSVMGVLEDKNEKCRALFYLGLERDSRIEGER